MVYFFRWFIPVVFDVYKTRSKDSQVKTQLVLCIFILFKVTRWQHVSASITRPSSGHKSGHTHRQRYINEDKILNFKLSPCSEMLYFFFWVISRCLNFICRLFETLYSIFIGKYVNKLLTYLPMKMEQIVPKRRHIKFRHREITQKKKIQWRQNCSQHW
jgi:hypothetical protein